MKAHRRWLNWFLPLLFLVLNGIAIAVPENISVSGVLLDSKNNPINGTFKMLVSFNDQPTTPCLCTVQATITSNNGMFGTAIAVPDQILTLDQAWYAVSIDTDNNGFDLNDRFGDFHQITSVPFSLTGEPEHYFETSGGHRISDTGAQSGPFVPNTLVLVPFSTPPGGVKFNHLALRAAFDGTSSYGIYDASGNLVISTAGRKPDVNADPLVFNLTGRLKASRIYYAAYTSTASESPMVRINEVPTLPTVGKIVAGGVKGLLPNKINLNQIQPLTNEPTLSFGLYDADSTSPKALQTGKAEVQP